MKKIWSRFSAVQRICAGICIFYFLAAVFGPIFSPFPPDDFSSPALLPPGRVHLLGTDEMGHDIFSMVLSGFRYTLLFSLTAALGSVSLGTVLAFASLYFPRAGRGINHLATVFLIIPDILLILFVAAFAAPTCTNTILSMIVFSWPRVFRIARARLSACFSSNKVVYTMLIGGNMWDVIRKLWHDGYPVIGTLFMMQASRAVTYETTLAFFGLGDPLLKTWGRLIRSALNYENFFYDNTWCWYLLPAMICVVVYVAVLSVLVFDEEKV